MIKLFNAFQFTLVFSVFPYVMRWIPSAISLDEGEKQVMSAILTIIYVIMFSINIGAIYDQLCKD